MCSDVDMAPILNRAEWKTRVTGQADFNWTFSPRTGRLPVCGAACGRLWLSGGRRAREGRVPAGVADASMRAAPRTAPPPRRARRSDLPPPARPLSYTLAGTFQQSRYAAACLRSSRCRKLETQAAGTVSVRGERARLARHGDTQRVCGRRRAVRSRHGARHASRARQGAQLFGERQRGGAQSAAFRGAARGRMAGRRTIRRRR